MNIPQSFLDAQAAAFQDKLITLLETVATNDALGGVKLSAGTAVSMHSCNVQYVNDKITAEEYGLKIGQDIIVTGSDLPVGAGAFIRYGGITFRVIEAPHYDAYTKLLAVRVDP